MGNNGIQCLILYPHCWSGAGHSPFSSMMKDVSPINYSYWTYLHQLGYLGGTTFYEYVSFTWANQNVTSPARIHPQPQVSGLFFFAPDNPDAPKRCRNVCHQVGLDQKTWKKKTTMFPTQWWNTSPALVQYDFHVVRPHLIAIVFLLNHPSGMDN